MRYSLKVVDILIRVNPYGLVHEFIICGESHHIGPYQINNNNWLHKPIVCYMVYSEPEHSGCSAGVGAIQTALWMKSPGVRHCVVYIPPQQMAPPASA